MDFKITIDDALLDGVAHARELSNKSRADDEQLASDQDYIAWIVGEAATSWKQQSDNEKVSAAIADAKTGDLTKLDALRADYITGKAV